MVILSTKTRAGPRQTTTVSQSAPIRQEADSKLRILEEGGRSAKALVQPEQ